MAENDIVEICKDFVLSVTGFGSASKTVLTAAAPIQNIRKQLVFSGDYRSWAHGQWDFARRLVKQYWGREDVIAELDKLEIKIRKQQIADEVPLVDDDEEVSTVFKAGHSIEVHVSRARNYIRVYGKTYDLREELKQVGLSWDPKRKVWGTKYSDELLKKVTDFVKKYDEKLDPVEENMLRCQFCGRWSISQEKDQTSVTTLVLANVSCLHCGW